MYAWEKLEYDTEENCVAGPLPFKGQEVVFRTVREVRSGAAKVEVVRYGAGKYRGMNPLRVPMFENACDGERVTHWLDMELPA